MIANQTLRVGDPLPSVRGLAKSLEISTLSVQRAYKELQDAGIVESVEGKGSFVADTISYANLRESLIQEVESEAKRLIATSIKNGITLPELQELIALLWTEN